MRRTPALALLSGFVILLGACSSSTGGQGGGSTTASTSAPGSTRASTATVSASATARSTAPRSTAPHTAPQLTDFRAVDLTWIGDEGWALGSAKCLSGSGTCDAIEHTTNGGTSWASLPAPKAGVVGTSCRSTCVGGVRFANRKIGYSFGRDSFFMTLDGGRHWRREPGNAVALEALDDTVLRVTTSSGCPPGCTFHLQASLYGNPTWKSVSVGRSLQGVAVTLGRAQHRAYLETYLNPAGGAGRAYASLYTSADDGAHWSYRGEPCPQGRGSVGGGEVDSLKMSVAPTGSAAIECAPRGENADQLITSVDGGSTWREPDRNGLGSSSGGYAVGAVTARRVVVSGGDATYLTVDAGARFTRVGAPGQLRWLGFGSTSSGRAISRDGRTIWSTRDAGASWRSHTFH